MAKPAKRSRQSRRASRLDFATIEIASALLPPEIVTRVAAFDMPDQAEEAYGILRGLKLRDEIARYYQVALAHWERFSASRDGNANASQPFVLELLRDCFGFAHIAETGAVILSERRFPIRHASHNGRVPMVIAPLAPAESRKAGIDEAIALFGDETRRRSATQLLQEYLNAADNALWGITSDGCTLRLMRDNVSLTRPAWVEADIEKILTEGLFADFSALWLLIHASRFGGMDTSPSDCSLERWRERGRIDGSAAKDKLRLGVESALLEFGRGFIENPSNSDLRDALQTGKLTRQAYYEELLRLVYRLIFLFAAEDRGLLHIPNATDTVRKAYRHGYSVGRLRERSTRSTSFDRHHDAWDGLRALFGALANGEPLLGLAALGGLFIPSNLTNLTRARITNHRLLQAIWRISWFRPDGQPMTRVNWRDMQTEELGSVYESLLELNPLVNLEARDFGFTVGDAANRGNERKTTGSYYTPDSLVQLLLTTTLDPVLNSAESRNPTDPVDEILKLSIIDPACGSGHFLLGAARRAAARIARHRSGGAPSQEAFQHALRDVVSNCIFATDLNPMAVELCKVALWIEALEPGKPLSFLDGRIRCGDSLIGVFNYSMLRQGLPDEAFNPLTGDSKAVAKDYKAINRKQRDAANLDLFRNLRAPASIADGATTVLAMPEDTLEQIEAKARAWDCLLNGPNWQKLKTACDMYVAAFLLPKIGKASNLHQTAVFRCRRPKRSGAPSRVAMSAPKCRPPASRLPRKTAPSTGRWSFLPSWHAVASMRWSGTRRGSVSQLSGCGVLCRPRRRDRGRLCRATTERGQLSACMVTIHASGKNSSWLRVQLRRQIHFSVRLVAFLSRRPARSTPTRCLPSILPGWRGRNRKQNLTGASRRPSPIRVGRARRRGVLASSCPLGSRRTVPPAPSSAISSRGTG